MTELEFDALIFDCDGTLALTADLHFNAFNAALQRQGARLRRDWYEARKGLDRCGLLAAYAQEHPGTLDTTRVFDDSIALTLELAGTTSRPNPPVAAFARRFHARRPMAVASNAETPVTRAILAGAGLLELFDVIVTVTEAGRAKPDPAMLFMAAEAMGVAPARCLVLEDSDQGLAAARAGGFAAWDVRQPEALARIEARR